MLWGRYYHVIFKEKKNIFKSRDSKSKFSDLKFKNIFKPREMKKKLTENYTAKRGRDNVDLGLLFPTWPHCRGHAEQLAQVALWETGWDNLLVWQPTPMFPKQWRYSSKRQGSKSYFTVKPLLPIIKHIISPPLNIHNSSFSAHDFSIDYSFF